MENPVLIFGANAIGKAALEIFNSNGVEVYGFLDENEELHNTQIGLVSVLGFTDDEAMTQMVGESCSAFVATDENQLRKSQVEMLNESRKVQPANAVHRSALLSESASIGYGNMVNAKVFLGAHVEVGSHTILHTGVNIDADCKVGDFAQIGTGSNINAGVTIEEEVFIGSGVTIVAGVTIGKGARVGAGSVVIADVKAGQTVFGNPAAAI
ncbi:acetyltransferase [Persicobacter psychrovividus]|uniref:Acetyltransferase n=1 Tax=Persicobacter psychrovividus TaxID=387638 RepID=A0ABM7VBM6_9BACT|nr:acetyltransferase [Persicobacter psychrovividus]